MLFPLLFTACGFELRGAAVLPPGIDKLHVVSADLVLRNDVDVFLQGSGARLVKTRPEAQVVLTLSNPRYDRRVLSVDPNTGHEREFELSFTLDVVATGPQGQLMLQPQTLSVQRDYVFDQNELIGSGQEEAVLRTEMRRAVLQQVLFRLRAATSG
ncbi:MAG: LPS-assembly lipoprotein [Gammaproteobacteria bacterium]